jgi:hypothetical protein
MTNKEKIKKIALGIGEILFEVSFVCSWTISSQNKIVAFVSCCLFFYYINQIKSTLKDIKLMDRVIDKSIMFFQEMICDETVYEFQGYCNIDKKESSICKQQADITQIKTFNGVQYIGFYKKKVCKKED